MDRLLDGLMHREQGEIFMHKLRERIGRQSEGDVRANTSNKGCGKAKNRKSRQVQMEKTAHVKGDERALWKQSKFVEMWGKSMLLSLLRDVIDVEDGGCGFESLGRSGAVSYTHLTLPTICSV
eukprot:4627592-Prorocentrum_lima.AAC.1